MRGNKLKNKDYSEDGDEKEYVGVGSFVSEVIKIILLAFLIIVPIRVFLFQPFFVQGASMEPNFENEQYLIINEFGYKKTTVGLGDIKFFTVNPFRKIEREKVLVFRYPKDTSKYFIKRVIGLPGEKIEVKNSIVTIFNEDNPNGFILNEEGYVSKDIKTIGDITMKLKDDEYFMMGDNRMFSSDSRSWGPVAEEFIIGEVLLRAWPLNEIKLF